MLSRLDRHKTPCKPARRLYRTRENMNMKKHSKDGGSALPEAVYNESCAWDDFMRRYTFQRHVKPFCARLPPNTIQNSIQKHSLHKHSSKDPHRPLRFHIDTEVMSQICHPHEVKRLENAGRIMSPLVRLVSSQYNSPELKRNLPDVSAS